MARRAWLTRTRLAAGLAVAAAAGGVLVATLLWRGQRGPILSQIPTGMMTGAIFNGVPMQANGRAYVIDDGVIDSVVTMRGRSSYSWSGSSSNQVLRVIDTATGRLLWRVTLNASVGAGQYVTDLATGRVFAIDPNGQQITVLDARQGAILASPSWPTDSAGVPLSGNFVRAALIDPRSGHVFVSIDNSNSTSPGQPAPRQPVVMLDGRSGRVLRVLSFPPGPASTSTAPYGATLTSYASTLSLALDSRPGRLDIFDAIGRVTVVDTASGRVVWSRRLRTAIMGAVMDDRSGRIVGFDASRNPQLSGRRVWRGSYAVAGSVVTIDAATGTVLRRVPGGIAWGSDKGLALDEVTGRVFVANWLSNSVGVVDASTGRLLRTVALGAPPLEIAADPSRRRVLVITNAGRAFGSSGSTIVVLDARDGAVLRTIPLGQPAYLLAVDGLTGHLVLEASSIQSGPTDQWSWLPSAVRSRIPAIPPPPPTLGPSQQVQHSTVLIVDPSGA